MIPRRLLVFSLGLAAVLAIATSTLDERPWAIPAADAGALGRAPADSLRASAQQAGISVGTALSWHALTDDDQYLAALMRDFDAVTLENASKWGTVQHEPDTWDWSRADHVLQVAGAAGLAIRAHPLVWDEHVPAWAMGLGGDDFRAASDAFIDRVVGRYGGRVQTWDVVNELIEDDGRPSDAPLFARRGDHHAEDAFRRARARDPAARLFYNDDAIAWDNARSRGVESMLRRWKAADVPVDGVGMQMHLLAGHAPPEATVRERIRAFADLGLQVEITELDVRTAHLRGASAGRDIAQARAFYDAVHACVAEPGCTRVTFWGFTDRHSPWAPVEKATLRDHDYAPKPAWAAVRAALEDRPPPFCADEFVPNGDFEDGISGWTANAARLTLDTARAANGRAALRVVDRAAAWSGPELDLSEVLSEGVHWSFQARVRADGEAPAPLKWTLRVDVQGAEPHFIVLWEGIGEPGTWVDVQAPLLVELPEQPRRMTLYLEGPPAGVGLAVDAVSLSPTCR